MQNQTTPLILTFGLADPVGAAGVAADLACFAAHGCHGLGVTVGLLIADTARVEDMQEIDADWVVDQARLILEDMPVAAIKVGALASIEQAAAIAEIVSDYPELPLILDPFFSSLPDSGLNDDDMLTALRQVLVPQATVLIVSRVELARMAETWREAPAEGSDTDPESESAMLEDVAELTGMGCELVLVTGTGRAGKGAGAQITNTLFDEDGEVGTFSWQHLPGAYIGAGNTISGALAALMARHIDTVDAVQAAQEYTAGALAQAQRFGMGKLVPNRFFQFQIPPPSPASTS